MPSDGGSDNTKSAPLSKGQAVLGCIMYIVPIPLFIFTIIWAANHNKKIEHYRRQYADPGDEAYAHKDYATALSDYQKYEKVAPGDCTVHHSAAWALIRLGRFEEARTELAAAIEDLPGSGRSGGGPPLDPGKAYQWKAELKELNRPNVTIQELSDFRPPPLPDTNKNNF